MKKLYFILLTIIFVTSCQKERFQIDEAAVEKNDRLVLQSKSTDGEEAFRNYFDRLGRLSRRVFADGSVNVYEYTGSDTLCHTLRFLDPCGQLKSYVTVTYTPEGLINTYHRWFSDGALQNKTVFFYEPDINCGQVKEKIYDSNDQLLLIVQTEYKDDNCSYKKYHIDPENGSRTFTSEATKTDIPGIGAFDPIWQNHPSFGTLRLDNFRFPQLSYQKEYHNLNSAGYPVEVSLTDAEGETQLNKYHWVRLGNLNLPQEPPVPTNRVENESDAGKIARSLLDVMVNIRNQLPLEGTFSSAEPIVLQGGAAKITGFAKRTFIENTTSYYDSRQTKITVDFEDYRFSTSIKGFTGTVDYHFIYTQNASGSIYVTDYFTHIQTDNLRTHYKYNATELEDYLTIKIRNLHEKNTNFRAEVETCGGAKYEVQF